MDLFARAGVLLRKTLGPNVIACGLFHNAQLTIRPPRGSDPHRPPNRQFVSTVSFRARCELCSPLRPENKVSDWIALKTIGQCAEGRTGGSQCCPFSAPGPSPPWATRTGMAACRPIPRWTPPTRGPPRAGRYLSERQILAPVFNMWLKAIPDRPPGHLLMALLALSMELKPGKPLGFCSSKSKPKIIFHFYL